MRQNFHQYFVLVNTWLVFLLHNVLFVHFLKKIKSLIYSIIIKNKSYISHHFSVHVSVFVFTQCVLVCFRLYSLSTYVVSFCILYT